MASTGSSSRSPSSSSSSFGVGKMGEGGVVEGLQLELPNRLNVLRSQHSGRLVDGPVEGGKSSAAYVGQQFGNVR
ncbi:hypothetical protein TYRP_001275 [Tyrophagus putrescentiae]|nr:hypothetical protein TYRP_001275 [Tyrophagus putrescentiae]